MNCASAMPASGGFGGTPWPFAPWHPTQAAAFVLPAAGSPAAAAGPPANAMSPMTITARFSIVSLALANEVSGHDAINASVLTRETADFRQTSDLIYIKNVHHLTVNWSCMSTENIASEISSLGLDSDQCAAARGRQFPIPNTKGGLSCRYPLKAEIAHHGSRVFWRDIISLESSFDGAR